MFDECCLFDESELQKQFSIYLSKLLSILAAFDPKKDAKGELRGLRGVLIGSHSKTFPLFTFGRQTTNSLFQQTNVSVQTNVVYCSNHVTMIN
jgi:hypothetical protein